MKLKWTLPAVEAIEDNMSRRILVAIRDNLSNIVGNVLSKDELVNAGVLAVNKNGQYVAVPPSTQSSSSSGLPSYLSVGYTSVDFVVGSTPQGVGSYPLQFYMPTNSRVIKSWYEVIVPFVVTGGPTVNVFFGAPAVPVINSMALTIAGVPTDGVQDGSTANFSAKATSSQTLQYSISSDTISAGSAVIFIQYAVIN